MFEDCVRPGALRVLRSLQTANILSAHNLYLAGGTALALQLGHRISEDLDFFTQEPFVPENIVVQLGSKESFTVVNMTTGTLHLVCGKDAKVSFLYYPYALVYPALSFECCPVADYRDIAAMKLVAVAQRGTKRDFVDLFSIVYDKLSITDLKAIVQQKYAGIRYSWPLLLRSIGYFADAENDPASVVMSGTVRHELTAADWHRMKEFLLQTQKTALRELQSARDCVPPGM